VVVTPTSPSGWRATPRAPAVRRRPNSALCQALALQDESGKNTVIVSSDLIGFRRELADQSPERLSKSSSECRATGLVLNSSHTHSGPVLGTAPNYASMNEAQAQAVRRYTEKLLEQVVGVVGQSIGNLAPATLEFRYGLAGLPSTAAGSSLQRAACRVWWITMCLC